jgi:hypothetical protein
LTQTNPAFSEELKRICTDVFEATGYKLDETDPATVAALFYSRSLRAASQEVAQSMDGFWLDVQVRLQRSFQAASVDLKKSCDEHMRSAIGEMMQAGPYVHKDQASHETTLQGLMHSIAKLPRKYRIGIAAAAVSMCMLLVLAGFGAGAVATRTLMQTPQASNASPLSATPSPPVSKASSPRP